MGTERSRQDSGRDRGEDTIHIGSTGSEADQRPMQIEVHPICAAYPYSGRLGAEEGAFRIRNGRVEPHGSGGAAALSVGASDAARAVIPSFDPIQILRHELPLRRVARYDPSDTLGARREAAGSGRAGRRRTGSGWRSRWRLMI